LFSTVAYYQPLFKFLFFKSLFQVAKQRMFSNTTGQCKKLCLKIALCMRSSRVARASDSQCQSRNSPGFDPSILRHGGISGAADETVLKKVHIKSKKPVKLHIGKSRLF
jgi:hypothetical protein